MKKYIRNSLNHRLLRISLTVFMPMLFVMIYLLVSLSNATDAYRDITHNIVYANQYTQDFKGRIDYSMYLAVINQKSVEELEDGKMLVNGYVTVNPYKYINEMERACDRMSEWATVATSRNRIKRVKNTLRSLEKCVKTLEEGIQRLLSEPELCRRLGENARRKAENEFSMEDNINKLLSVYESVRGWER